MTDTITGPAEIPGGAIRISATTPEQQTRVVLFYVDDQAYTVPKTLSGSEMLGLMEVSVTSGGTAALLYALQAGLGIDGYRVLRESGGLEQDQLADLLRKVEGLYMPQIDMLGKATKTT